MGEGLGVASAPGPVLRAPDEPAVEAGALRMPDEPAAHAAALVPSDEPTPPARGAGVPVELAALEAAARAALVMAGAADRWDAATRLRALAAFDQVINTMTVARGRVLTAERDAGTWALKGDRDLPAFVGRVSRQGLGAGFAQVRQAATLAAMPAVAEALVDGPVTPTHVQLISRAAEASPLLAAQLATPEAQAQMVALAARFDGAGFGRKIKQLSAGLDPAARQREHDAQRARRFLTLRHTSTGTEVHGFLDTVAGHELQKAIDAHNPRPAKGDTRPRDERQAEALASMARQVLTDERTTPGVLAPGQAVVTISQEAWTALRAARDGADCDNPLGDTDGKPGKGSMPDLVSALRDVPPVTDEDGRPWPASEIGRALCDCLLTSAVIDARGQVLDLGNTQRLFTRAHWLALSAAGQTTCAVEGCTMPLRYTELHHMAWWHDEGGPTNLANCAPECSFHHHEIHRNDIRITRRPDGSYDHRWPDGRPYGGTPSSL